ESGALYISIDDNEAAYLKVMMDEIFGGENFLAQIAYERSGVSGLGQGGSFLVNTHESILVYAKNKSQHTTYNDRGLVKLEQKDITKDLHTREKEKRLLLLQHHQLKTKSLCTNMKIMKLTVYR